LKIEGSDAVALPPLNRRQSAIVIQKRSLAPIPAWNPPAFTSTT
jgi:hypothetical protein